MLGLLVLLATASGLVLVIYVAGVVRGALRPPRTSTAFALSRGRPTQPSDLGLAATEWTLERPGARLPVWEIELAERGTGPSVVLLHGWGRSRVDMLSRLAPFLEVAERVLLIDLRGHGDATGRTTLGDGDEQDMLELLGRLPPGPVVLVGHSLGAVVALRTAAAAPDRVAGVIAIAPYDSFETPLRMRLAARELPRGLTLRLVVACLRLAGIRPTSGLEAARAMGSPLLVVQGGRDRVSPPEEAAAIAEAGHGRLELFADAEHADHEFREPARFSACCKAFVAHVARERTTGGLGEAARRIDVGNVNGA